MHTLTSDDELTRLPSIWDYTSRRPTFLSVLAVWQGETRFVGSHDWHHQWCGGINGDEYADHDGSVVIESCFQQLGPAAAMCCGQAESRIWAGQCDWSQLRWRKKLPIFGWRSRRLCRGDQARWVWVRLAAACETRAGLPANVSWVMETCSRDRSM